MSRLSPPRTALALAASSLLWAGLLAPLPVQAPRAADAPPPAPLPHCRFVAVAAGVEHSLGLLQDGTVWAWGGNGSGQLGDGTNGGSSVPVPVAGLPAPAVSLAAGDHHSLAVLADGTLWSWGANGAGQLGTGDALARNAPVPVTDLPAAARQAEAGTAHSVVVLDDGTAWTWGRNTEGQLGDGTNLSSLVPILVGGLPADVLAVAAGAYHSLALLDGGEAWAWGWNNQGQLGDGTWLNSNEPVQTVGLPAAVTRIAGGDLHSLAILADESTWAWGWNSDGQLGDGTNLQSNVPRPVTGLPNDAPILVAGGAFHSLCVLEDGSTWSWGRNDEGQLGDGTNAPRNAPGAVSSLGPGAVAAAGGASHSLAVLADGTAWGWGRGAEGQLGHGGTAGSNVAVAVSCDPAECELDVDCDDGLDCTIDSCDSETLRCGHEADDAACDDGDPCTIDRCEAEAGCLHEAPPNRPPVADAGPDRLACEDDEALVLDGSDSFDPDAPCDAIVAWDWDVDDDGVHDDASGELTSAPPLPLGAHRVSLRVTDRHGATGFDSFLVTVEVCNEPPTAAPGGPYEAECNGPTSSVPLDGSSSSDPDGDSLTYAWSTNCPGASFEPATADTPDPLLLLDGPPPCPVDCTVTLVVHDGELQDQATTTLRLVDTSPPVFTEPLPAGATVGCDAVPEPAVLTATDACGEATVRFSESRIDGDCPGRHELTRTWTATDGCGLETRHVQVITVEDGTPPAFVEPLPADATFECDDVPEPAVLRATDACGEATVRFSESRVDGDCPGRYELTRTWVATDECGRASRHVQVVTVEDGTPPAFVETLPADAVAECDAVPEPPTLTATDACGEASVRFSEMRVDGDCPGRYRLLRTWVATDECGRASRHVQVITVEDGTPPAFVEALPADATAECDAVPEPPTLTATDACGEASVRFSEMRVDGDCPGRYELTRTWTATDECGLETRHVQVITVEDGTPPAFAEALPADATAECDAVPEPALLTATDACGEASVRFSETRVDGDCPGRYELTRTWTATDECGLETRHVQTLRVEDRTPPSFTETLPADATAECDAVPEPPTLTATDACGRAGVAFSETRRDGDCPGRHELTRTWVATDECGLETRHVQVLEVVDTTPPVFTEPLPPDATFECDAVPEPPALTATDACGEASVRFSETRVDGDCPGRYELTRTWTATDECGLEARHVQTLRVEDTSPPVVEAGWAEAACLWPPQHRYRSVDLRDFALEAFDACSEPLTWRLHSCSSSQPDDGLGDGHTSDDCIVAEDGSGVNVRGERQGGDPAGRTYLVRAVATDACGNESEPTPVGTIHVPHDQRDQACR